VSARGGLRRYENYPREGDVTWWWWLEFDDGTSMASGSDTRAGAIAAARAAARKRGLATVALSLAAPLRLQGVGVEADPHDGEDDHEHDRAEDGSDEAREATEDERD
jgi:hypothetical protein